MNAEPQLEELSAYLDHELTGSARQDLESHLAGCETCRRRLEALRETVQAVRGLPLETPARTFTIPAQRRQAVRWEPFAWVGGLAAAAVLVIAVGFNLPHGGLTSPSTAFSNLRSQNSQGGAGVGAAAVPGVLHDQNQGAPFAALADRVTVSDPRDSARQLTLSTDAASYRADGMLTVHVTVQGMPFSTPQTSTSAGLRIVLVRAGAGVELYPGETSQYSSLVTFTDSYAIGQLGLSEPVAGSYRLIAIWRIPDGSGTTLEAEVPVQITSS